MNYVIGAITDYGTKEIEPWVSSLVMSGFDEKKVMMVYNARPNVVELLNDYDFDIWMLGRPVGPNSKIEGYDYFYKERGTFNICVERFFHAWRFLSKENDLVDLVVMTDVKDVVFQENPIKDLMERMQTAGSPIPFLVTTENIQYMNEPWGMNNMRSAYGDHIYEYMQENEIFNCGVLAGYGQTFIDMMLAIYLTSKAAPSDFISGGGGPDQAALNILLSLENYRNQTKFTRTFAAQAGTTNDPTKMDFFKENMVSELQVPYFQTNKTFMRKSGVTTPQGDRYPIVHQYDRVPEWNTYFKNLYTYEATKNGN